MRRGVYLVAVLLAAAFAGEAVGVMQMAGILAVLLGTVMAQAKPQPAA